MEDIYESISHIEDRIAELPAGYISRKTIRGKVQYYRQWREEGKIRSKYIREEELEEIRDQIGERKQLEERLKELKKQVPVQNVRVMKFQTNFQTGAVLEAMVRNVRGFQKRDCFDRIMRYLRDDRNWTRVCAVYGLRRTGKTTMLYQAIAEMEEADPAKTAYVKMRKTDIMNSLVHDLDILYQAGYRYIFIDEVTLVEDFIDSAALLSDLYVPRGMRIVLSGTDSLGFWFARDNELYDRVRTIHTTFIPYREYSRLLGIDSIDEYICYGGMLSQGELAFDDEDAAAEDSSFRDDESTRRYIDTAIARNIQHSLAYFEYGHYFGHLRSLYEADELTSAINRIIEDMNHSFVEKVITKDFVSHDLGISERNLRNEREESKRTDALSRIDKQGVTEKLMQLLNIRNREDQTLTVTDSQALQIRQYLKSLDLIVECPIEYVSGAEREQRVLFSQPGMRYCQAQALVYSLMQDETFSRLSPDERDYIIDRILGEVRGRMLEDVVLLEAMKALPKRYRVFKLQFVSGEYDMVICDRETGTCAAYEIKHSSQYVREQARHLLDEEKLAQTSFRFGRLTGRFVLYLGEDMDTEEGIAYRNVERFLKKLPTIALISGLEETGEQN
ncbi:MAG: AAA family ATPase [Lachnospiraceae bacterium]|nr:AAA family ATPase [Lachnospiraceae bacterium]